MTYHCGLDFPGRHEEPRITCDGCGLVRDVKKPSGLPFAWFLDGKAAPGWKLVRIDLDDGTLVRRDHCPRCRKDLPTGKEPPP